MGNPFASGRHAIATCDICGFQYKLRELRELVIKTKNIQILACPECWTPDQPQLQLGMYPIEDPQALRNPRPDNSYYAPGNDGAGGSRMLQWGWAPVGGAMSIDAALTPNDLVSIGRTNDVTIEIV
jgi:hypothetical protein